MADPSWGAYIWPRNLAAAMWTASWRDADKIMRGLATAGLESNLYERRTHTNEDGSIDRGIWMINNKAHPACTDEIAFNYHAATKYAYEHIYKPSFDYGAWAAYTTRLVPFLNGRSDDPAVRSKVIIACEGVGNFLKDRYGLLV